jgi:hypothetical protein
MPPGRCSRCHSPRSPRSPAPSPPCWRWSFLADLAQSLVAPEKSQAVPERLLRDGSEIQRVISGLHGGQRAQLGCTEAALGREYEILPEEVEAGVRRTARGDRAGAPPVIPCPARMLPADVSMRGEQSPFLCRPGVTPPKMRTTSPAKLELWYLHEQVPRHTRDRDFWTSVCSWNAVVLRSEGEGYRVLTVFNGINPPRDASGRHLFFSTCVEGGILDGLEVHSDGWEAALRAHRIRAEICSSCCTLYPCL